MKVSAAKSLKIGNFLYNKQRDEIFKIEWIDSVSRYYARVGYRLSNDIFYEDNFYVFRPIRLNESLLLRCGFELDKKSNDYSDDKFGVNCTKSGLEFFWDGKQLKFFGFGNIEYLHQLQNLYFLLTENELDVNIEYPSNNITYKFDR